MIKPIKLKVEGFSNILGPLKITFRGRGVRILKGFNGEGKTTILSALAWVLYGKPLKVGSTVETWEHKRGDNYLGTKVTFTFSKDGQEYKVIRCREYTGPVMGRVGKNRLILVEGNEEYIDYQNKRDLQKYLVALLGYDYELFINATIFPQKITRFIELKGAQRKDILEEIFDLSFITRGYTIAKSKAKELGESVSSLESEILNLETQLSEKNNSLLVLQKLKSEKDKTIADKKIYLTTLQREVELRPVDPKDNRKDLVKEKKAIEKSNNYLNYRSCSSDKIRADSRLSILRKDRKRIESSIRNIKYDKVGKCSVCGSQLTTHSRKVSAAHYKAELIKTEEAIRVTLSEIKELEIQIGNGEVLVKQLAFIDEKINELSKTFADNAIINARIDNQEDKVETAKRDLRTWEASDYTKQIAKLEAQILETTNTVNLKRKTYKKTLLNYNAHKFVMNKVFSKTGFKSYLLDMALYEINSILKTYANKIGFRVELVVADNAYHDILAIIYVGEYPVIYQDLSGGQSQLVNAAISLSLAEFMSSRGSMAFLALDEITTNLDPRNQERIGEIISSIGINKEVWVITHSPELIIPDAEVVHVAGENQIINTLTI